MNEPQKPPYDEDKTKEIIVFDRILKDWDRNKVEACLCYRWFFVDKLPSDHS